MFTLYQVRVIIYSTDINTYNLFVIGWSICQGFGFEPQFLILMLYFSLVMYYIHLGE